MDMSPQRWVNTCEYLREVFGREDAALASVMPGALAAGLPDIAVSADVGRLLMILTQMACARPGSRGLAVELGTLAGYSAIWIARGLPKDSLAERASHPRASHPGASRPRLYTVEPEPKHADFAQRMFERAGLAGRIELRRAKGLDELPRLARELGPGSVDLVFFDAIKTEYPDYFRLAKPLIARGGLLVADNALGSSSFGIDDPPGASPERDAVDRFNRMVAADADFEAACVPIREGVLLARRTQ